MSASVPVHYGWFHAAPQTVPKDLDYQPVPGIARVAVAVIGIAALWAGLTVGLALVSEHQIGMLTGHAWGFAAGVVSYVFLFTGFVVGLVYLVTMHGDA
jgi:hypothetical protein